MNDPIDPSFRAAFDLLYEAHRRAEEAHCSPWDFAVPIQDLRSAHVPSSTIVLLLNRRFVDHDYETTRAGATIRRAAAVRIGLEFLGAGLAWNFAQQTRHDVDLIAGSLTDQLRREHAKR